MNPHKTTCPHCDIEVSTNNINRHIGSKTCEKNQRRNKGFDRSGKNNPMYGKKGANQFTTGIATNHSIITKQKISDKATWDRVKFYTNNDIGKEQGVFYIAKFSIDDIEFIKVGITKSNFKKRYQYKSYNKYKKELLLEKTMSNLECAKLEKKILKSFNNHKFVLPENLGKFDGRTECLKTNVIGHLKDLLLF